MGVVLDVRPEWRDGLAAVTHVDGTARIQTVRRAQIEGLVSELRSLWSDRFVELDPPR